MCIVFVLFDHRSDNQTINYKECRFVQMGSNKKEKKAYYMEAHNSRLIHHSSRWWHCAAEAQDKQYAMHTKSWFSLGANNIFLYWYINTKAIVGIQLTVDMLYRMPSSSSSTPVFRIHCYVCTVLSIRHSPFLSIFCFMEDGNQSWNFFVYSATPICVISTSGKQSIAVDIAPLCLHRFFFLSY